MSRLLSYLSLAFLAASAVWSEVSPDGSCGMVEGGNNLGYTCPGELQCCSQNGYCGASEEFCLTSVGCQGDYSNATDACTAPVDGTTVSPDGTCGTAGAGEFGYKCPTEGDNCCSVAGYCGSTEAHCDAGNGCQADYGTCA
ncbi:carbohydrate-binding module family 18 protein [Xylariomycetidae sp. FL0641]|nr:carbohydrate-binding module family 18 protein [Xylariomycetidae sp. FL0641]KAI0021762.1 carbohydrate-binding module family 18 protein [Xylariomycetidae sp. FL0641]